MSDQDKPKTITPTWDGENLTVPVPTEAGEYVVGAITVSRGAGAQAAEHPAPWRWDDGWYGCLLDANGTTVIEAEYDDGEKSADVVCKDHLARELIRLAPEMEQALRYFVGLVGDIRPAHPECAKAIRLLAALDAARKET